MRIIILQYLLNYYINKIVDINLYFLALFISKYLCINWFKLVSKELKKLILNNNIIQLDRNIDR